MINSYEMQRALVVERQNQLLGEARQHRLARHARRARRNTPEVRSVRSLPAADPGLPAGSRPAGGEERAAA